MSKIMLVNVAHVEESRVAILEDGVLAQYEIETLSRTNIKGNIHNAVVENVHPALEAAFLRIAPDLKGFLPLDEVNFKLLPARTDSRGRGKIGQHLHPGQKLMVQVVREPFAGKPPTVTTYFSLPGRYLVLMPGVDSSGISRKIEDAEQREKLKKMVEELSPPDGFGIIVRTAGVGQSRPELQRDLRYLLRLWESIQRASRATEFPGLVYRERDLVIRTMRDYFTPDISEVWIDNPETYERALDFVRDVMPSRAKTIKLYEGDRLLFSKFNLEEQIESIYKRRVPLPSGGEIVIDGTEALTAIDVNSKGAPRQGDAEENALSTNLEAAVEIARQLRLRDLGGLVVVDFIDMMASRNQKKVEKVMRDAMKTDRAKYDVTKISKLGLMEIARQRIRSEKMGASYTTCPTCEGYGLVKNVEPAGLSALRKLQARCLRSDFGKIRMGVPPDVASWILNQKRDELVQIEKRNNIRIAVDPKPSLLRHESEFEFFPREKVEVPPALVTGDRPAPPTPPDLKDMMEESMPAPGEPNAVGPETAEPAAAADGAASGGRRRRRRRRRRGRGGAGAEGEAGTPTATEEIDAAEDDGTSSPAWAGADEAGEEEDEEFADAGGAESEAADVAPLPGDTDATGSGSAGGADAASDGDGEAAARRRRRRRRRRRGRGRGANGTPAGAAEEPAPAASTGGYGPRDPAFAVPSPAVRSGEDGPEVDEPVVPRGVRSDVLMPAATGGHNPVTGEPWKKGRHARRRRGGRGRTGEGA